MFTPPHPTSSSPFPPDSAIFGTLLNADLEALEESCTLIESLSLDVEDVRLALAREYRSSSESHGDRPLLSVILNFIEHGSYSPLWRAASTIGDAELKRKEKEFDMCKAALIKSVVEVASEELVLWDEFDELKPGGEFVCRMVRWIKDYVRDMDQGSGPAFDRDDLVICASLSLGNLTRKGMHITLNHCYLSFLHEHHF